MSESPITSSYPGVIDSWNFLTDKEDLAEVSDINKIKNAILKNQTEMGTDPAGSLTDVKTRLDLIQNSDGALQKGTDFPVTNLVDGRIFYRTDLDALFIYDGAGWDSLKEALSLISTTTSASSTNTGDIAIVPSKKYFVSMIIANATASANSVILRFNSSATANGYAWGGKSLSFNTTPVEDVDGDESDAQIVLALDHTNGYADQMTGSAASGFLKGEFYIDTNKVDTVYSACVNGSFVVRGDGGALEFATFGGVNIENITISSFELVFSQNASYTIKVYELD